MSVAERNRALVNPVRIGEQVRAWRLERGLAQREAAELCGVGKANLWRMERGVVVPELTTLAAVATALGHELGELFVVGEMSAGSEMSERCEACASVGPNEGSAT